MKPVFVSVNVIPIKLYFMQRYLSIVFIWKKLKQLYKTGILLTAYTSLMSELKEFLFEPHVLPQFRIGSDLISYSENTKIQWSCLQYMMANLQFLHIVLHTYIWTKFIGIFLRTWLSFYSLIRDKMMHRVNLRMAYKLHESQISSFSALQFIEVIAGACRR